MRKQRIERRFHLRQQNDLENISFGAAKQLEQLNLNKNTSRWHHEVNRRLLHWPGMVMVVQEKHSFVMFCLIMLDPRERLLWQLHLLAYISSLLVPGGRTPHSRFRTLFLFFFLLENVEELCFIIY
jgi:hypothetical protein